MWTLNMIFLLGIPNKFISGKQMVIYSQKINFASVNGNFCTLHFDNYFYVKDAIKVTHASSFFF